ncbi:MAG: patatin-like phospholipase family protein [Chloroflexota bacterium]|nr:patatin-like phospholipase family protein [Chloroflexota bacterium]
MRLFRRRRHNTVAFVLSGGGNYGALQVGALQVLLEADIYPDLLVGTSAGALNVAFLATDPTPDGAQRLGEIWCSVHPGDIGTCGNLAALRRLLTNKISIYNAQPLAHFLESHIPPGVATFGDLKVRTYTVAARLPDGDMHTFGDSPADRLLDGMMASAAIAPFYPPWPCDGALYMDGGVLSKLPLMVAVERGATEIYALSIQDALGSLGKKLGMMEVTSRALSLVMDQQVEAEKILVRQRRIPLHVTSLDHNGVPFWNFDRAADLIARGRAAAEATITKREV